MIRNQVYFTEEQDRELKLLSALGYGKYSELVREGVDEVIKKKRGKKTKKFDPWKDFVGMGGKGGPKDLSKNLDYYLYVEPYENKGKKKENKNK